MKFILEIGHLLSESRNQHRDDGLVAAVDITVRDHLLPRGPDFSQHLAPIDASTGLIQRL